MKHATNTSQKHPEYGRLTDDIDLTIAMLIAETADGQYQPIAPVSTLGEAREIAAHDYARRLRELERGDEPACPEQYVVWAQSWTGEYLVAAEIDAASLTLPARKGRR